MSSAGNAGSIGILHFRMGVITARESTSGQIILKILIIIINIFYSKAWCFCKEIRSHACIISSAKCSRLNLPTDTIHFPPFHIKLRNQSQIFFSNVPFAYRTNAFFKIPFSSSPFEYPFMKHLSGTGNSERKNSTWRQ